LAIDRLGALSPHQVTVAAIAREAGVSRSVFYTQFSGLEDLLSEVVAQTAERFGSAAREAIIAGGFASRRELALESLARLVEHVDTHATFYAAAASWKMTMAVHESTTRSYAAHIQVLVATVRDYAPEDHRLPNDGEANLVAEYIAGGITAAVTAWLRADRATPGPVFCEQLLALLPEWLNADMPSNNATQPVEASTHAR
jgi:AcrR family transcriptional regulator